MKSLNQRGLGLVEAMVSLGILATFIVTWISYLSMMAGQAKNQTAISTRDRIGISIRNMASMPAAIRNSARAADATGTIPVNPELSNCIYGMKASQCQNDQEFGFSLYSPIVFMTATGTPLGIQRIAAPIGTTTNLVKIDSFGVPCSSTSIDCLYNIFTSFKAECGPAVMPAALPADLLSPNVFAPMATCTVADLIKVYYTVKVDETMLTTNPSLEATLTNFSGSVFVSVKAISGNDPQ